jgi:hypothetical protein
MRWETSAAALQDHARLEAIWKEEGDHARLAGARRGAAAGPYARVPWKEVRLLLLFRCGVPNVYFSLIGGREG